MSLLRSAHCTFKKINPLLSKEVLRKYSSEQKQYDIIIAGGGMVGTTLACALGKNRCLTSRKILLLEGSKEADYVFSDKYRNRVVALNPNSQKLFEEIGVWQHIAAHRFANVKQMQVWDAISDAMITFNHDDLMQPIAYIVENDLIVDSVLKEVRDLKNVSIMNEAKIVDYKLMSEGDENVVTLGNGEKYSCQLLLGCDGVKSKVRDTMGVQYLSWNYEQMGIVATLELSETPENFVAWQRFLPTGPIALLPLKENLSSLVWSTTPDHAKHLLALSNVEFIDAVNEGFFKQYKKENVITDLTNAFDSVLKSLNFPSNAVRQLPPGVKGVEEDSRAAFPLGFGHSVNYVAPGVALVGDAAHRIHPMAGQGVNLGFGDVATLNRLLEDSIYAGNKLDDLNILKDYETQRQMHNIPTMLAIEGLHKLYTTEFLPVVILRSLGLQFTQVVNPLKKSIIGQAMH